jgi:hypothetical protein
MSEYSNRRERVEDPASEYWNVDPANRTQTSAWAGWVWFAGILMIIMGSFGAIEGLVALFNPNYYVVGPYNVLVFDLTAWGWVHLIVGIVVMLTGVALLTGAKWARWATVVIVSIDAIIQIAFLGVYPIWSTIVIAFCVVIIWAIVVHSDESRIDL